MSKENGVIAINSLGEKNTFYIFRNTGTEVKVVLNRHHQLVANYPITDIEEKFIIKNLLKRNNQI